MKEKELKDLRQEEYEKLVKLLRKTHKEIMDANSTQTFGYVLHKTINKDDQKKLLKEIKDEPMSFLDLDKRTYLDYGFCADALETAQKAYSKNIGKLDCPKEDRAEMIHSFEDLITKRASTTIAQDLDEQEAKRSDMIKGEKLARTIRREKRAIEELHKRGE